MTDFFVEFIEFFFGVFVFEINFVHMVHLTDFRSMVINIAEIALEVAASAIAQIEFRKLRYSINMPAAQATLRAMK
jgi:hypothetical protein